MNDRLQVNRKNNKYYCLLFVIVALQLANIIYWSINKSNFFVDELYSMGDASVYANAADSAQYITLSEEWEYNEWINNGDLKKYLLVSDEEQIFDVPFLQNVKVFLGGHNYFWFLNGVESLFGYDIVTARPGIVLNIIFFLIAEFVLVVLLHRLRMNPKSIALCLTMFGFSAFFIGLVVYIRFYMLVMMLALVVILLHHIIWITNKMWQVIICQLMSLGLIYLMLKNTETTVVFAGGIIGCFAVGLMLNRRWKTLTVYSSMPILGIMYILISPKYRNILFNLNEIKYTKNIFENNIDSIIDSISEILMYLTDFLFGHRMLGIGILLIIVYMLGKVKAAAGCECKQLLSKMGFILVLAGVFVLYSVFIVLTNMTVASRYYSFGMLLFVIIFWYVVDSIMNSNEGVSNKREYGLLTILVILSCVVPFVTRNIEYIYEEDRYLIDELRDYQGKDVILLNYVDEQGISSRHEVYDCVNLMSSDTAIYPVDITKNDIDCSVLPEEFLVWEHILLGGAEIMDELLDEGYQIEKLGETHISRVYYAEYRN